MIENYNEDGFTLKDIDSVLQSMEMEGSAVTFNQSEVDLLTDALEFYKETHYIG